MTRSAPRVEWVSKSNSSQIRSRSASRPRDRISTSQSIAHPLAGGQEVGQGVLVLVEDGPAERLQALGCTVKRLTPEEHDLALATTSHLPHVVASLLAGQLPEKWRPFAATGFRDTTRVAAGDPGLWTAIARENAAALSLALDRFDQRLQELRKAVLDQDEDGLTDILTAGKKVRDALGS